MLIKQLPKRLIKKAFDIFGYELVGKDNAGSLTGHLRQIFALLNINLVLDVGANEGQYGTFLRNMGYKGNIISFEPVPKAYLSLQQCAQNDNAWSAFNFALGSENSTGQFNVTSGSDLSSFLTLSDFGIKTLGGYQNDDGSVTKITDTTRMEIKTLDAVYENIALDCENPRIFLKMDTQGYDLEVMKGAQSCLDKILGIQSEISILPLYDDMPDYSQSLRFYNNLGYGLTGLYTVLREPKTMKVIEYDCVMIRDGDF